MRYLSYLEGEPTLESYRLCHAPRPNLAPVFICPFVVLTNERGEMFNAMRGVQGQTKGTVMNMGIYRLNGELDDQCPMHVPWEDAPVSEPYYVVEDRDAVSYVGSAFRLDWGVDTYRWEDGGGRLQLEAKRLGQVATFWVPEQEGYDHPQMLRSHLGKAIGHARRRACRGPVHARLHLQPPGRDVDRHGHADEAAQALAQLARRVRGRNPRGRLCVERSPRPRFRGRSPLRRRPLDSPLRCRDADAAHASWRRLSRDSGARRHDGRASPARRHRLAAAHLRHRHLCPRREKAIAKSWNYTESFPLNWQGVADYQAAHTASTAGGRRSSG